MKKKHTHLYSQGTEPTYQCAHPGVRWLQDCSVFLKFVKAVTDPTPASALPYPECCNTPYTIAGTGPFGCLVPGKNDVLPLTASSICVPEVVQNFTEKKCAAVPSPPPVGTCDIDPAKITQKMCNDWGAESDRCGQSGTGYDACGLQHQPPAKCAGKGNNPCFAYCCKSQPPYSGAPSTDWFCKLDPSGGYEGCTPCTDPSLPMCNGTQGEGPNTGLLHLLRVLLVLALGIALGCVAGRWWRQRASSKSQAVQMRDSPCSAS